MNWNYLYVLGYIYTHVSGFRPVSGNKYIYECDVSVSVCVQVAKGLMSLCIFVCSLYIINEPSSVD